MTSLGLRLCMVEREELRVECERLRGLVRSLGVDPDVVDVRDPGREDAPPTRRQRARR